MLRVLLAAVALGTGTAVLADDPPKIVGGTVGTLKVKVDGDKLTARTPIHGYLGRRTVLDRNETPPKEKAIDVSEEYLSGLSYELKYLLVTDTHDKETPQSAFKARFKEAGWVVWLAGPLAPEWKKKFRKGTVFVEPGLADEGAKADDTKAEKEPAPLNPKAGSSFTLGHAKLKGESIEFTTTKQEFSQTAVKETVTKNGKPVEVVTLVEKLQKPVTQTNPQPLKVTIVTDSGGKELKGDELAKRLAEPVMAVNVYNGFDPEWRKLFPDDMIYLVPNYPPPK